MELITDDSILWYFPPDDKGDIPRYAIQSQGSKNYEKIIPMIKDDVIELVEDKDNLVLSLLNWQIGKVDMKEKQKVDGFMKHWNKGLVFLEQKENNEFEIDDDDDEQGNDLGDSLKSHLLQNESKFIHPKKLKFRYLTWNIHGQDLYNTDQDLSELFLNDEQIDIYFIAFQEVIPLNAKNLRSSSEPINNWIAKILSIIGSDYKPIQTNKLLGLGSILIIRNELSINFKNLSIDSIGTGILNFYGNKGGIITSFDIYDYKLALLNVHFAAGEKKEFLVKRRKELQGIKNYIKLPNSNGNLINDDKSILFDVDDVDKLTNGVELESDDEEDEEDEMSKLSGEDIESVDKSEGKSEGKTDDKADDQTEDTSDTQDTTDKSKDEKSVSPPVNNKFIDGDKNIIFIGGDLNYRINASNEIIQQLLNEKDHKSLLDYDTLTQERDLGRILDGFQEGKINFPPTYKINDSSPNQGEFVTDRKPSYTDRILVSQSKHVELLSYKSPNINISDHRPVIADYNIQIPIINNEERNDIVTKYLKKIDDLENNLHKTEFQITNLESKIEIPILTSSTIEIEIKNIGNWKSYWEIIDSVETQDLKFPGKKISSKIEPIKGVLPKSATQLIKISTTLPIGCKKFEKTLILRGYNSQDHFITCTFHAKPSFFGSSIDELNLEGQTTGIPKPIYTLINYLTNHIISDMFDETKLNFTHELEKKLIKSIDNNEDLNLKELEKADTVINGSSSRAVSRVLFLLLRNLDGGIVSSDLSTFLLNGHKDDQDILEKILESLPPLRANVLIYLSSFLRLCIEFGISKDDIFKKFENILLEVPKQRKRDYMFGRTNYEKLRRDFLEKLLG
ncbi:Inositol polyphosphate 5-phosphatase OCRL-1 [Wickerhamomyces ciferrii]|uniref:Inositol polyphosphate 5-phosphatase OCRL-1 n=1 Tax=Wickerhamomyces ciferrii (strain ATCC 14091 / BCRC 22168 / CBS 111 / JCM 3599 / NBRC 0793 / NRRL Y-1031 F-60-10) TaxID=1206466 RepID=K0KMJ1_WICCF|nr:Inositol polyphosphate 5-phosphatase OCRL-1 [Wickerhamomyces ciferrii]CCH42318.1 Inositol polyphosphate 5-phosphatase OCRL-1 [Wickerhamomyces ciferrii]